MSNKEYKPNFMNLIIIYNYLEENVYEIKPFAWSQRKKEKERTMEIKKDMSYAIQVKRWRG